METRKVRHSMVCMEEADEAVAELRAALVGIGVVLPSLRIDPLSYARESPCPALDLGYCSVDGARRLAAALREAGRER
ncbi:hypothetical protein [Streptomyces sp. NBC_01465]|uniref:hypothetical protein n=1 Tax=Streptomyces sp. NBC_01465 TaxID=2903878 RepID=UPI002E31427E|nr:hypothetical protein [Streptomyces sp. NBC_01465]